MFHHRVSHCARTRLRSTGVVALLFAYLVAAPLPAATFQGFGEILTETATGTGLRAPAVTIVSADGWTVVGAAESGMRTDFDTAIWNPTTGLYGKGFLFDGLRENWANDVSADGSVIVGSGVIRFGNNSRYQAYRWSADVGKVDLGNLVGEGNDVYANAVTPDGTIVVGTARNGARAFMWKQSTGMVELPISHIPMFGNTVATEVSADGSFVAGNLGDGYAFRWSEAHGTELIGKYPFNRVTISAMSNDGSLIAGYGQGDGSLIEAFKWTPQNGIELLGHFPGQPQQSHAFGMTGDGSIIVGVAAFGTDGRPVMWDAVHGMRDLKSVFENEYGLGPAMTGWTIGAATSISDDGKVIVGTGTSPRGRTENWIVNLRENQPEIHRVAFTEFSEPVLGTGNYTPGAGQQELGFRSTSSSSGGVNPLVGVAQGSSSRILTHRSASATTTFNTVDLTQWDRVGVSLVMQLGNTEYEATDNVRIYVTNGIQSIDLTVLQGAATADFMDQLADERFVRYGAAIPDDWMQATLVITSYSNSSQATERYDFDRIEFRAIAAIPEPAAFQLLLVGMPVLGWIVVRRKHPAKPGPCKGKSPVNVVSV